MKMSKMTLLSVAAAGLLAACGSMPGELTNLDDASAAALVSQTTTCGDDGTTVYDVSCDKLQASCTGTFTCMDEYPSRDGSCTTWGTCEELVDDGTSDTTKIKYGPVITIKPKG